ncbi:efflux RND transporter periplasmic adaptor subunit [Legionella longbeachae]|uniref:Efflux transporter, RND family, MFP subunit n=1 Tax=Legionella longbeachae serogroup 1 (strain NSW150) TaxID=661367 RepID=D3HJE9_LEGLN|nr:HlyD family efflux transporter periplasmic adaptor subunit [Legionella longbeachae]VEE03084.1 Chemiosmotic efflux system C protein B [Legionella oakridgensis]HBD7399199.1 HlyD family efflux transporter periplasmic adaptor subunit [Legionella pneumophila]ARB90699.1 efflux transporter periplasmic adaptor subunit [Legionella longbeachae]ARM32843.1 HlyD family efflux transporter periplasmic adaptor subunit [Legionella longbeachae]EEZ94349.1 RND family efflux transporter [Legionella longbeachae 
MKIINLNLKKLVWYSFATILLFVGILFFFSQKGISVETAKVKSDYFVQYIEDDAKTRAIKIYTIVSPVSGELLRINLTEGDKVNKDELIAIIKPKIPVLLDIRTKNELEQELGTAEALYEQAKAESVRAEAALQTAWSDLKRKQPLAKKGFVSETELEHTQLEYQLRQKEYNAALRKLHAAEHYILKVKASLSGTVGNETSQQDKVEIHSPVAGSILRVIEKSETTIEPGTKIMDIADVVGLEVVADILSEDAAKIPPHARVIIKRWGGTYPLEGRVRVVEPSGYTKISALGVEEQRVNVIIDIITSHHLWKNLGDGYKVDVEIIIFESPHSLVVPMSALFRVDGNWAVFVVKGHRAYKKVITILHHNPDQAVVGSGLKPGDEVVLYPSSLIHDGVLIKK